LAQAIGQYRPLSQGLYVLASVQGDLAYPLLT